MTEPGDGSVIADKGWPARKLYLSPEAIALMENHCKGTPLTMSAYVDMLIKRDLEQPSPYVPGALAATVKPEIFDAYKGTPLEPPAITEERAKQAALQRGIGEAKAALLKQPTKKDFDLDV